MSAEAVVTMIGIVSGVVAFCLVAAGLAVNLGRHGWPEGQDLLEGDDSDVQPV